MTDFNGAKPVRTERDNDVKIVLVDGASGSSATAKLSVITASDALSGKYGVLVFGKDASGNAIEIPIGTSGIKVEAVDLDIRDLAFATDKVDVSGSSISISGTVDVSGSSVTVTATDLDIRDLAFATDKVDVSGSSVSISGTVDVSGSSVTVSATDLDIRDLSFATDKVDVSGSSVSVAAPGARICAFNTSATVGVNTEVLHFYPVTSAKNFIGNTILVGARGAVKVRFGISTDGLAMTTVKGTYFQDPKENIDHEIDCLELLGDGTKAICVGITNLDAASSDVYSTIQGYEA